MLRRSPNIFLTQVVHRRVIKPVHQLSYRLAYICVDLRDADTLFHRWSPFGLRLTDFGPDGCPNIDQFVRNKVQPVVGAPLGAISLIALPRFLGRGFNPISLFVVHDMAGVPCAVLYEVRNTFGEKHHYCTALDGAAQQAAKAFHVSPFLDNEGTYTFNFNWDEGLHLAITKSGTNGPELYARMDAKPVPLTRRALAKAAITMPVQGAMVLAAIHYEALKLVLKRAPFFTHPKKSAILPLNEAPNDS